MLKCRGIRKEKCCVQFVIDIFVKFASSLGMIRRIALKSIQTTILNGIKWAMANLLLPISVPSAKPQSKKYRDVLI
jgi:hypothetical protein